MTGSYSGDYNSLQNCRLNPTGVRVPHPSPDSKRELMLRREMVPQYQVPSGACILEHTEAGVDQRFHGRARSEDTWEVCSIMQCVN